MIKNITLCADDFAQHPAISQGIINLIKQKRLSATSCMVNTPYWQEHASWLTPFKDQIDIGLHFNLTLGSPLATMPQTAAENKLPSLNKIILNAYLQKIAYEEVYSELNRQLDQFASVMGRLPDFIDGHQHVHCFPIIRQALLNCYQTRLRPHKVWLRNICPNKTNKLFTSPAIVKKLILYFLGGHSLQKQLSTLKIPHNPSFAGIHNFDPGQSYADLFPLFLAAIDNKGLIMCHPGLMSNDQEDPIAANRVKEYEYFLSDAFVETCQQHQISLTRLEY